MLAAHFALAACQTSTDPANPNIYGSLFGQGIVGNKDSVMISNVWNEMDAFKLAQRYCEQWGRNARFSYSTGVQGGPSIAFLERSSATVIRSLEMITSLVGMLQAPFKLLEFQGELSEDNAAA